MDLTATSTSLAQSATDLVRLLPGRITDPVLNAVVTATRDGVELAGRRALLALRSGGRKSSVVTAATPEDVGVHSVVMPKQA
ncbi:hypothetical protein GIY23_01375 [Allosaccharopolyspora coralli]|uniref:Uncharacterized protein n=1 Tax=Allosaccharopolyspora coralli TaxID=2665642 RepID=A0A5Q3Q1C9_9PSEU|nr:hypothetical protein [Allosaccharopolyspora coralli]QGK68388.1 hypothetical protein GIY23_01375 [Allosaccharopolyspora coralli]